MLCVTSLLNLLYTHMYPGVHCEGPFISREKKGAHRENLVQDSICPKKLSQCYESLDNISIVTLAPELSGATETIKWLCERGIVVSMGKQNLMYVYYHLLYPCVFVPVGHSMAALKIAERAVREGASLITHLFNAMLPVSTHVISSAHSFTKLLF